MNISARVHELRNSRKFPKDVLVVEHHEKEGSPARISVMIYGAGLAVVTLERDDLWRVSHISKDNHYRTAKWPEAATAAPNIDGALYLIEGLIDCVVKHDGV
jgi:hypothetical protein